MLKRLEKFFKREGVEYKKEVELAEYTTVKAGGRCEYMIFPEKNKLSRILKKLNEECEFFVLGGGSNLLVSDRGFRGVVINTQKIDELKVIKETEKEVSVYAGCGVRINRILSFCLKHDFSGLEFLAGLPATVGGIVKMNAGAFGSSVSEVVRSVELWTGSEIEKIVLSEKDWGYREFKREGVIIGIEFVFKKAERNAVAKRIKKFLKERLKKQPLGSRSFGCAFKNPPGEFAGRLIELAGLKGYRIGGAEVSKKHANFIINTGNATASDIINLIKLVQKKVLEKFDILLEPEVKLVGCEL
jgi:UDP-N-acetylmuramate dehydrogenase